MFKKLVYTLIFFVCILASYFLTNSVFADTEIPLTFRDTTRNITIPDCTLSNNYYYYLFVSNFDTNGVMVNLCYSTSELVVDTSKNPIKFFSESGFYNNIGASTGFTNVDKFFSTVQGFVDRFFNSFNEEDFLSTHVSYPSTISISKEMWEGRVLTFANTTLNDVDGNVVFQGAPQEGAIATIAKSIDFSGVLAEVLKMLPTILIVLIGLIALMKAIKLLYSTFRSA